MNRKSGILFPISSLPSKYGIGSFGKEAFRFIDFLSTAGMSLWQILPLNPIGEGNSPYQSFSSNAIDEIYIDLDLLVEQKLVTNAKAFNQLSTHVKFNAVRKYKNAFLRKAFKAYIKCNRPILDNYISKNKWVKDYAAFVVLKNRNNNSSWNRWISTSKIVSLEDNEEYLFQAWLQMIAFNQWNILHQYANKKGISIIGDIPFYVAYDSVDVWKNKKAFCLNEKNEPAWIAGVPPDYFSPTGQRWGNPIYNWDYLKKQQYDFLIKRIGYLSKLYDIIRIDHFRAFDTYWRIPSDCPTAIDGNWEEAPGYDFFATLYKKYPTLSLIAEDLGEMRQQVYNLRNFFHLPGMNVIQFTFKDCEILHKGEWNKENQVAYLGTHDNETITSFINNMDHEDKLIWKKTLRQLNFRKSSLRESLIAYLFSLKAKWVIISLQDLLGLDSRARINIPGEVNETNWTWRLTSFKGFEKLSEKIKQINKEYKR